MQVPQEYYNLYKAIDPSAGFESEDGPFLEMSESKKEDARKIFGMVSNIDDNLGKVFQKLEELKIADNTVVIFILTNGT